MFIRIFCIPNKWGISHDVELVESMIHLQQKGVRIERCNALAWLGSSPKGDEPIADIHIYLETPLRLATQFARYNIMVVNQEWWPRGRWDWAFDEMSLFVFKCQAAADLFVSVPPAKRIVMPWRAPGSPASAGAQGSKEQRVLYVIGASVNKLKAARTIVTAWRPTDLPLEIWCSAAIAESLRPLVTDGAPIEFQTAYKPKTELWPRQQACAFHCVASCAEGFGFTMAEAVASGARILWTDLPVYRETWAPAGGCIRTTPVNDGPMLDNGVAFSVEAVREALDSLTEVRPVPASRIKENRDAFVAGWRRVWSLATRKASDPLLPVGFPKGAQAPKVGVITVTRNRAAWWPNMVRNVTQQEWPIDRYEWIIVDSGDEGQSLVEDVEKLRAKAGRFVIRYVRAEGATPSIGAARNAAVREASSDADVFVTMDDDDHYPPSSISRRVAWLLASADRQAIYCSALPMYDVTRYISAMNVPPLDEPAENRVSEATLTFRREFWNAKPFPEVSMAEGQGFLEGRIQVTAEVPPTGIIVSFIHTGNTSSRRIPAKQEPNGCHFGFSDDFFRWLHTIGMAGLDQAEIK